MKLTSDSETLAENKVLILYILNRINKAVSNDSLLKLVLSIEDMNYFYFQQFLLDLLEMHYISKKLEENEEIYQITELGKETLSFAEDLIPGITKLKVDSNIKSELNTIEEESSITAEFIPHNEHDFTVKCKIIENSVCIFEVATFACSREHAKAISDKWKQNANTIYPEIIKLLN